MTHCRTICLTCTPLMRQLSLTGQNPRFCQPHASHSALNLSGLLWRQLAGCVLPVECLLTDPWPVGEGICYHKLVELPHLCLDLLYEELSFLLGEATTGNGLSADSPVLPKPLNIWPEIVYFISLPRHASGYFTVLKVNNKLWYPY